VKANQKQCYKRVPLTHVIRTDSMASRKQNRVERYKHKAKYLDALLLLPVLPIRKSVLHCTINGPQQCFPHESNALILHTTGSKIIKYYMFGCCFTSLFQYTTITIKLLSHNEYLSTVWYDFHKKYKNKSCGLKHSSMYKSFSVYPLHLQ